MIDPQERWRPLSDKPDYAGFLSFGGAPLTQSAGELAGFDVAIVGAPTDDLVSDRPGTRFAPRAIRAASCPPGPHLEAGVDAFSVLRIVDYGDAAVIPADPVATHAAIERVVGEILDAGVIPVTLGGDHSITEPCIRAVAARRGPVGLIHFDTHTDTGREVFGVEHSHGTPMFRLVESGAVDGARYAQIGLRGYWPGPEEFAWQRERGIASYFMHDVRELGIGAVVDRALAHVGDGPVYVTCRRRRARSGIRARHRDAGARRHDLARPAPRRAADRGACRPRGRRRRRGAAECDRLRGHHRARGRAHRPRAPDRRGHGPFRLDTNTRSL